MSKDIRRRSLRCITCRTSGFFVTSHGLMCRHHALAAIDQEADSQDWTPVSVKQSTAHRSEPNEEPDRTTVTA